MEGIEALSDKLLFIIGLLVVLAYQIGKMDGARRERKELIEILTAYKNVYWLPQALDRKERQSG